MSEEKKSGSLLFQFLSILAILAGCVLFTMLFGGNIIAGVIAVVLFFVSFGFKFPISKWLLRILGGLLILLGIGVVYVHYGLKTDTSETFSVAYNVLAPIVIGILILAYSFAGRIIGKKND